MCDIFCKCALVDIQRGNAQVPVYNSQTLICQKQDGLPRIPLKRSIWTVKAWKKVPWKYNLQLSTFGNAIHSIVNKLKQKHQHAYLTVQSKVQTFAELKIPFSGSIVKLGLRFELVLCIVCSLDQSMNKPARKAKISYKIHKGTNKVKRKRANKIQRYGYKRKGSNHHHSTSMFPYMIHPLPKTEMSNNSLKLNL